MNLALRPLFRYTAFSATAIVLALLCALQAWTLWRAPTAWFPSLITVQLKAGETLLLGQRELAAPQADKNHLALRRDADGAWMLRNLSASKQVVLQYPDGEQRMGSVTLQAGQRFLVENKSFDVDASTAHDISFTHNQQHWRYDGATLYRDGRAQASCPDAHLSARLLSLWNRAMPRVLTVPHALSFGGNVYCDNRLGLDGVTPGSAYLARNDGELRLSAGSPDGDRAALTLQTGASSLDLRQQELPLAGVTAIIVGHTRFQLVVQADLTLAPSRRIALFNVAQLKLPPQIDWQWQQRALWSAPHNAALWPAMALTMALMIASVTVVRRWQWQGALAASAGMLATGVAALLLQRAGHPPSAACSLALAACASYLWLMLPGRLSLMSVAAVVLLAVGLLMQLELGLGVNESSWLNYFQKSAALLAVGVGIGGVWRIWAKRYRAHTQQRTLEWLLALFAAVALGAMGAEVLWGDETGVFDLQPVELAKLALTALTAHALALRFSWHAPQTGPVGMGARWMQLIAPALLFLTLLGMALVQVDDFSPLILLLVWSTSMAFAYAVAARNKVLAAALVCMVLAAVGGIVYMRCVGTDDLIKWGFYADRFLVWLDPAEHPHTGQQLLLGARAITEGGWWGSDHLLGLSTLGQSAGSAMRIPAVQDDFAAAFFLNRHGLLGGLLLWTMQAAFVIGIVQVAVRAYSASVAARDFRHARSGRFSYFMLCGGAAFVLGQFLLSWGTNLAIFPIMGQPMSFLSAGGSHLLFFLCPLLAFCAISAQSLEENEPCRSTSNTKS